MSNSNKNNTLFVYSSDEIRSVRAESYNHIVVEPASFNIRLIDDLAYLKQQAPATSIILLAEHVNIPFAVKLQEIGLADNLLASPLSDSELNNLLKKPGTKPFNTEPTLQSRIRRLEEIAYTDELTGLCNRRFIDIFLANMNKNVSGIDVDMSLMLFDIDNLKKYNDNYGHQAGDKLLLDIATTMKSSFRGYDLVARIGGDEFAVILWQLPKNLSDLKADDKNRNSQTPYPSSTTDIAARFQNHIAKTGHEKQTTISGAIIEFSNNINKLAEVFDIADKKLYQAKQSGKNIIL